MGVALRWLSIAALTMLTIGLGVFVPLWIGTRGDHPIPALVTGDPALPAAQIAGHRLHLRIHDGPAGAPTVIVLHGGPGGDFRSLQGLADLSDAYHVVFYDQRGAGLSERVPADFLTLDGYLQELAAVIDHIAPNERITLIGHSWGAMLAVAYLGVDPAHVDRAVLIEPGYLDAVGRDLWQDEAQQFMSGLSYVSTTVLTGFRAAQVDGPDPYAPDDFLIGRMVRAFASHPDNPYHCGDGYDAPAWRFGAQANASWDAVDAADVDRIARGAETYGGPVLLMAGACNDWIGAELQAQHRERFSEADLVVVREAGHDLLWDNPHAALSAIRDFLRQPGAGLHH
ncbi:alpha/beta fold hydrolase [Thetidibacter halocola]|nr:alpha/beta fold hydrolase [Thetidibacter halocola]